MRRKLVGAGAALMPRMILGSVALAAGNLASGQDGARLRRVAFLYLWPKERQGARIREEFPKALQALGYREGRNISYDWRFGEDDFARLPALARELVAAKPEVMVTQLTACTRALADATAGIPIVGHINDPVREGYAVDGVIPRANVTGLADLWTERLIKILELLKSFMPGFHRLGVLAPADMPPELALASAPAAQWAARHVGVDTVAMPFRTQDDVAHALEALARERVRVVLPMGPWRIINPTELAQLAIRHRIAAIDLWAGFAHYGGFLAYGADWSNVIRRQSDQVHKILSGMPLSRIPFERPERFELVINGKTADALGLSIPQDVYLRADRVLRVWKAWEPAKG